MAPPGPPSPGASKHRRNRHNSLVGNEPHLPPQHPLPSLPPLPTTTTPAQNLHHNTPPKGPSPAKPTPPNRSTSAKMPSPPTPQPSKAAKLTPSRFIHDALTGHNANSPHFLLDVARFNLQDYTENLASLRAAHPVLKGSLGAARSALGKLLASDGGGEEEVGVARGKAERLEKAVGESEGEMRGCGLRIVGFEADIAYLEQFIAEEGGDGVAVGDGESVEDEEGKLERYEKEGEALRERVEGVGIAM